MSWEVNDKELEAVLGLPAPKRYEYFVKHVADAEQVWGLRDAQGFALQGDDDGRELIAVWPHRRYAQLSAQGEWSERSPESISLGEWLDGWLPELAEDGRGVAVFPDPDGNAIMREPDELAEDLRVEAAQYE